jgi:DNA polymerase III subunit epsilon
MSKEKHLSFAALDLECATSDVGNICEVGLVIIEGGEEVRKFRSLVHPVVESFGDWQRWNFDYTLNDTLKAPSFAEVWATAKSLIGDLPVVAHNATEVECKHLGHAFSIHGLDAAESPTFYCTLELARAQWPDLPKHGIKHVAKHFGWALDHHNPESDARVCGSIVQEACSNRGLNDWAELVNAIRLHSHRVPHYKTKLSIKKKSTKPLQRSEYLHELVAWERTSKPKEFRTGQQFVLSGFDQSKKAELRKAGANQGLVYKRYLKGAVDFLVADERMGASKYAKCQAQEIPILTEAQFVEALKDLRLKS